MIKYFPVSISNLDNRSYSYTNRFTYLNTDSTTWSEHIMSTTEPMFTLANFHRTHKEPYTLAGRKNCWYNWGNMSSVYTIYSMKSIAVHMLSTRMVICVVCNKHFTGTLSFALSICQYILSFWDVCMFVWMQSLASGYASFIWTVQSVN